MGSEYKPSENVNGNVHHNGSAVGGEVKVVAAATAGEMRARYVGFALRVLGMLLTLVAAVVVGVDKESKVLSVNLTDTMPPLHFHVTANYHYMSSLVFFVVTNSMACAYAAVSLILSMITGRNKSGMTLLLILLDMLFLGLLCSANGAAAGVGIISRDGNAHLHWDRVCNLFDYYCDHMFASLVLSILGSVTFLCTVLLAAWSLHKKSMEGC